MSDGLFLKRWTTRLKTPGFWSWTSVIALGIAVFGLWGFYRSFDPIPAGLTRFAGLASNVQTATGRYSRAQVTFQLNQTGGESAVFSYQPKFKRFFYLADHLKDGMPVEVIVGSRGRNDIWGLSVDGQILMTPLEAREARLTEGQWGLGLFARFLAIAIWCARQASASRRKGD